MIEDKDGIKIPKVSKEKYLGTIIFTAVITLFIGAISLYAVMYFFPEPFQKVITESREVKNVNVNDTGIADAVDKVFDAVVVVKTYYNGVARASGTGFIYKRDGNKVYVLTNNHVINNGDSIYVLFTNGDQVVTKVEGKDAYSDIAVLSIDTVYNHAIANIGSSEDARVGDTVFTVGAPVNSDAYAGTVTRGILSGKNRLVGVSTTSNNYINLSSDIMMSVLQTDASINSGNSGGPLCNANGEVIGITSLKLVEDSVEGMGFAIPIETAIRYASKLEKGEAIDRPYLGVQMYDLPEATYRHYQDLKNLDIDGGVYIEKVESNSPASNAGIKEGDIIVEMDKHKVSSIAYLRYLLYNHDIGDTIVVKVHRNGEYFDTELLLNKKTDL